MLRTALNPTRLTARETVLTVPRLAWAKCTLLTSRKSLCVSATSLRISCVRSLMLSSSELATRWMRATESDNAGKSLLWRMRRNRKSSVALLCAVGALAGAAQARSASRKSAADTKRAEGSRARARSRIARNASSTPGPRSSGNTSVSLAMRYSACQVSLWWIRGRPVSSSTSTSAAE